MLGFWPPLKLGKVFMERKFYTYAWLRKNGTPYYIGKGKGSRAHSPLRGKLRRPSDKNRIIFLKRGLTEEEALRHEIYMIYLLGRKDNGTGILRNRTNGGEGTSGFPRLVSDAQKLKISLSSKGIARPASKISGKENISAYHKRRKENPDLQEKFLRMVSENGKKIGKLTGPLNKGRKHPPEVNSRKACIGEKNPMFGKVRITNGTVNTQINIGEPIPEGFRKGITRRNSGAQTNKPK